MHLPCLIIQRDGRCFAGRVTDLHPVVFIAVLALEALNVTDPFVIIHAFQIDAGLALFRSKADAVRKLPDREQRLLIDVQVILNLAV